MALPGRRLIGKRKVLENFEGDMQAKRQVAWCSGQKIVIETQAWRPVAVYRAAAKKICNFIDNLIRQMTVYDGLNYFVYDGESDVWGDWKRWPSLILPSDHGSDMVAALFALIYGFDINCSKVYDSSHANNRTNDAVLSLVGLKDFFC